jgi:hypothetical protein
MNENELSRSLIQQYGPLVSGKDLMRNLGFRSHSSFARARKKGLLGVAVFELEGRRGPFARTQDIADWMASLPGSAGEQSGKNTKITSEEEAS